FQGLAIPTAQRAAYSLVAFIFKGMKKPLGDIALFKIQKSANKAGVYIGKLLVDPFQWFRVGNLGRVHSAARASHLLSLVQQRLASDIQTWINRWKTAPRSRR